MAPTANSLATFTGRMASADAVWRPDEVETPMGRALIHAGILKRSMTRYIVSDDDGPDYEIQYDNNGKPFYMSDGSLVYPDERDLTEYSLDWSQLVLSLCSAIGSPRAEVVVPGLLWSLPASQKIFAYNRRPVYFVRQLWRPEHVGITKTHVFDNNNAALVFTGSPMIAKYALPADACRRCFPIQDTFTITDDGAMTVDGDFITEQLQAGRIEDKPPAEAPQRGTTFRKIEKALDRFTMLLFERISKGNGEKCRSMMKAFTRRVCAERAQVGYDVFCKILREKVAPHLNVKWDTCHDMTLLYNAYEMKFGRRP